MFFMSSFSFREIKSYRFYQLLKKIFRYITRNYHQWKYGSITKEELKFFFEELGIKKGDVLMVHSSLSKMGNVKGGASTVIQALLEILDNDGTLAMPSFPAFGKNADYVKTSSVFDVICTPSKMGIISETFRKIPGVKRSYHLTDAVCAYGKYAAWLTNEHHLCLKPHEEKSPFKKLIDLNAKVLLIGVHLDSLTMLHASEDAIENFMYPVYLPEPVHYTIIDENKSTIHARTYVHNPETSEKRKCNDLWPYFVKEKFAFEKKWKSCTYRIILAKEMHYWLISQYKTNGTSMYTPHGIKK